MKGLIGGITRRVLIMDDAPGAENLFRKIFDSPVLFDNYRLAGFARNKREASYFCREFEPHIALLDLRGESKREGLHAGFSLRRMYPDLRIVIITFTDVINLEAVSEAIHHEFEFVDKTEMLNEYKAKMYLDLLSGGMSLPLPTAVRKLLIRDRYGPEVKQKSIIGSENFRNPEWTPSATQHKIAIFYRDHPQASEKEIANILKMNQDTIRKAASRLRNKLRQLGYDIPEDESGRQAVVIALRDLKIL